MYKSIKKLPGASIVIPLQKEVNQLLKGFSGKIPFLETGIKLVVDVREGAETVTVIAEIPGVDPKEVNIFFKGNTLTIKGRKKAEKVEKGKQYHRAERRYGDFERTVDMPSIVDMERAEAECSNGILRITIPKSEHAKTKQIPVI